MPRHMDYDVIVVGSGPAGATAAYWLAQAGCRVVILEKARLPRYKTCGGAIPLSFLQSLPFDASPPVETVARRMQYALAGYADVTHALPDPGIAMVMRDRFDAFLVDQARVDVRDGVAVTGVVEDSMGVTVAASNGETVRAGYLVGADGANSTVARCLGLRRRPMLAGAVEAEVTVPDHILEQRQSTVRIRLGAVAYGYSWVFAKGDHLSVGAAALCRGRFDVKGALEQEVRALGADTSTIAVHGHPIPVYWRPERLHSTRCLLVGDAAGLADGLIGEGIRYAMHSGRIAAQSILSGDTGRYSSTTYNQLGRHLGWARWCGWTLYHFTDLCRRLAIPNARLTRLMGDILGEQRPYQHLPLLFPALVLETIVRCGKPGDH